MALRVCDTADCWKIPYTPPEAILAIDWVAEIKRYKTCENVQQRGNRRLDMSLRHGPPKHQRLAALLACDFWTHVKQFPAVWRAFDKVAAPRHAPDLPLSNIIPYKVNAVNVQWSAPRSRSQSMHTDNPSASYFTALIPIHQPPDTGCTEFRHRDTVYVPNVQVGNALVFRGDLEHRGLGNKTNDEDRVFAYMSICSVPDENVEIYQMYNM